MTSVATYSYINLSAKQPHLESSYCSIYMAARFSVSSINGEAVLSFDHLISYDLIKTRSFAGVRSGAESAWRQNSDAFRQMEAKYWSVCNITFAF